MSEIKRDNNQPSKYPELNDYELEIVCGGTCGIGNYCDGPKRDDPDEPETKL